ncbi:MAG: STAS domain-containing protein [Bacteroidota bacterium]|nr:STAS domain-containing protein [Bacteroidota bacterium]
MAIRTRAIKDGTIGIIEIKSSLIGEEEIDELREAVTDFIEQGNKKLILDLSRVGIINSAGIGALISAYTNFSKNGGDVVLIGVNKSVKNVFIITKLSEVFEIQDKIEDAIDKFSLTTTN